MRVGWNADHDVEAVVVPRWLGVADRDYSLRRTLMLPIPFNFVYAFGLWAFLHIKFPRFQDEIDRRVNKLLREQYRLAYSEGFEAGVKDGREKQKFEMAAFVDATMPGWRGKA